MIRRNFLQTLASAPLVGAGGLAAQQQQQRRPGRYDILIRNGEARDPGRSFRQRADVAILDGKIAAIEPNIPPEQAVDVVDATGLYVTPGLVDLHTHCFYGGGRISLDADPISARSGTTAWVDAGSFASDQMIAFRRFTVARSQTRIFGYVHLYPHLSNPDIDIVKYVRAAKAATGECVLANPDVVLGVKVFVGSNMNGRYSLDFLKIARELADEFKTRLMVHISFAPPETTQVMELLRAGDVVTHCHNGHTLGLVDSGYSEQPGKLKPGVAEARARGVLFDVGHGSGSFNFNAARNAIQNGLVPDTISTDLHADCINGPTFDLPTTLTKYLHLGLSFDDVLLRATANPARIINRVPGMGSLTVGGPADIALLALEDGEFRLVDSQRNAVTVRQRIVSRLTICRGRRLTVPV